MTQGRVVPIGRAGVELLVIVVGVLAALAVDRWVAGVDERDIERAYLEALRVDFVKNRSIAIERAEAERELADLGRRLIDFLEGRDDGMPSDEVVLAAELSGYTFYREYSRAAWDDLSSTGGTVILRDAQLRIALAEFYNRLVWRARLDGEFFDYTLSYRYPARTTIDPDLRLDMNLAFVGWGEGFVSRMAGALSGQDLDSIVSMIRDAPELAVPLGDVVMARQVSASISEEDVELIDAILQMIDQSAGAL